MMKISKALRSTLLLLALIFMGENLFAAKVDSVMVYSPSMDKEIECRVVTPKSYSRKRSFPTVYLLHGYSGDAKGWVNKYNVEELSDRYSVIIVAADGGHSSWYWDSPVDSTMRYETFVSSELVEYVDTHYNSIKDRNARAITGLSMGGQGALYLAFRHQDTYGAVASMSGGVDIRPFPTRWDMAKRLGTIEENPENWEEFTVMNQLDGLRPNSLAIAFDCGIDDFFYEVNCALHEQLLARKIPHSFTSSPGAHTLPYWRNSLQYHLLFFSEFFKSKSSK